MVVENSRVGSYSLIFVQHIALLCRPYQVICPS